MTLAPGTVFAGFTIVRTLGVGGMGTVYLARHPRLPRAEALKLLRPEFSHDPDFTERFAREADIVAGLDHPNIVGVNDRGTEDGQLWISMPFIDGLDAEQALAEAGGSLPAQRAVRIVAQVGAALDFAHRNGLWHRDVKPANILLAQGHDDEPERVWLTDFGIAKAADEGRGLTKTGNVIATFDYASPEQIEGRHVDHRVDIYALGGVLYKLLTGSAPYPGATMAATLNGHLNRPPPRPTEQTPWLAPGLDEVIVRAMAKDPDARYPTCRTFTSAAQAALHSLPEPPPLPYSFSATRAVRGSDRSAMLGPLDTTDLPDADRDDLVALVRQSRLFDLPATLPASEHEASGTADESPGDEITIAVRAGTRTGTVSYLAAASRRPEELDDLLHRLEAQAPWHTASARTAAPARPPAAVTEYVERQSFPPYIPPSSQPPGRASGTGPGAVSGTGPGAVSGAGPGAVSGTGPVPRISPAPPVSPAPPKHRSQRRRVLAALAAGLLVIGTAVTAFVLTNDTGRQGAGGTSSPTEGGSAAGAGSRPSTSAELGLPNGPALPDSVLVAAHDTDGNVDLFTVDSTTGETQVRLTSQDNRDTQPLISPDRTSVMYLSRHGAPQVWVVGSDGSGARALFDAPPQGCGQIRGRPAWNPADPSMLAVVCLDAAQASTLQLVTTSGDPIRTLVTGVASIGAPAFSPDGSALVYWGSADPAGVNGVLFTVRTGGGAASVPLTDPAAVGLAESPTWSPDGMRIAFHVVVDPNSTPINTEVVVMDADGSNLVQLAPSDGIDQDPAWSPDGSLIAFKSDRADSAGVRVARLWIMGADGSGVRLLSSEAVMDGFDAAW